MVVVSRNHCDRTRGSKDHQAADWGPTGNNRDTKVEVEKAKVGGEAAMSKRQYAMVMDLNKCLGCQTCTIACKKL